MNIKLVYMTAPNQKEGKYLANLLIRKNLAACVNIIPSMISVYEWENKIVEESECVLIAKTIAGKVSALISEVQKEHSYVCPAISVLPVENGNHDYLQWIEKNLGPNSIGP